MKTMTHFEKFAFPIIFAVSAVGYGLSWIISSEAFAEHWISREDGLLETGTFIALTATAMLCLYRVWTLRKERSKRFVSCLVLFAGLLVFGAGEEISWGQRMLGIETPEYFQANNAQNETNLHNLVIAGVGVNKLVFGKLLALGVLCYLIPLPILYRRSVGFAKWVDRFAIPVPRTYHVVAVLLIIGMVETSPARKRGEINEYALGSIAFLIFLNPLNRPVFLRRESTANLTLETSQSATQEVLRAA